MYLKTQRVNWRVLTEGNEIFVDLYNVTDNVMKEHRKRGMGIIRHRAPISLQWKEKM